MSLECLAILGVKNEPLYIKTASGNRRDRSVESNDDDDDDDNDDNDDNDNNNDDVFGFLEAQRSGLTIRQEFMIHAALDRLEEILGSPKHFDIVKMQRGTKWMGCLLPMEDCEIYGYVTPSNIKILALVKRDSVIPLTKRKDVNIKVLLANVHDAYIKYSMNPFTSIRGKIEKPCRSFEQHMNSIFDLYDRSVRLGLQNATPQKQVEV